MPWLIIIVGAGGLLLILGGYAMMELSRPYPEERDAKRKSKMEAKRLQRHAELDAIMAHAELIDRKTKLEIKRQYMRDQAPHGILTEEVTIPDQEFPELEPTEPVRHRIRQEPVQSEPVPAKPDNRNLRQALAEQAAKKAELRRELIDGGDAEDEQTDTRSLRRALAERDGTAEQPEIPETDEIKETGTPVREGFDIRAALEKSRQEHDADDEIKPAEPAKPEKSKWFNKKKQAAAETDAEQDESVTKTTIEPEADQAEPAKPGKRKWFNKKKPADAETGPETKTAIEQEDDQAETAITPEADQAEPAKPEKRRWFGKKKTGQSVQEDPETRDEPEEAPAKQKKRGGLFGRKKTEPEPVTDNVTPEDEAPESDEPVHIDLSKQDQPDYDIQRELQDDDIPDLPDDDDGEIPDDDTDESAGYEITQDRQDDGMPDLPDDDTDESAGYEITQDRQDDGTPDLPDDDADIPDDDTDEPANYAIQQELQDETIPDLPDGDDGDISDKTDKPDVPDDVPDLRFSSNPEPDESDGPDYDVQRELQDETIPDLPDGDNDEIPDDPDDGDELQDDGEPAETGTDDEDVFADADDSMFADRLPIQQDDGAVIRKAGQDDSDEPETRPDKPKKKRGLFRFGRNK